jgi:hypothetical protein
VSDNQDTHIDRFEFTVESLAGRIMGQDALIRLMLGEIVLLKAILTRSNSLGEQRQILVEWLDRLVEQANSARIDIPEGAKMKAAALTSIHLNIGDIIQAIDDANSSGRN